MKLSLRGHQERYTVEQSLAALFPGERPVYGEISPEDSSWAEITLREGEGECVAETSLAVGSRRARRTFTSPLSPEPFRREGQRRHAVAASFFLASVEAAGERPPWGMLTGVRPDKPALWALLEGKSPEETREMLEETYFLTPSRSALALETAQVAAGCARDLSPGDIAVYVGIPFCPTRCAYCSFVSQSVERSFSLVEPYVDALIQEIRAGGRMAAERGLRVRAFYMGGGTPTTLSAAQLDRVLEAFAEAFSLENCGEITVEAGRPDTITADKLAVLRDRGVTRISVNPQSMEDKVLRAIGRSHTAGDIERAMDLAAKYNFPHVNMDLIAGLPEDTPQGFARSLARCLAFGTDHLTVHTLALKKGSRILEEGLAIPPGEAVGEMLSQADGLLRHAGFAPYYLYRQKYMSGSFENTGWSRDGDVCRYNVYIMSELCSILSFGAGGSTKAVAEGRMARFFNVKYPKEYIERPEKWRANQQGFAAFYEDQ